MSSSSKNKKGENVGEKERKGAVASNLIFYRERVVLLSRIVGDLTVDGLRGKKESCSTRIGLRVGTRFRKFPQTP